MLVALVVFLPLFGALASGTFGRRNRSLANGLAVVPMVLSAFLAVVVWLTLPETPIRQELFPFIQSGGFAVSWAIYVDRLTAVMFCVVTLVSAAVHVYAVGYMQEDASPSRFMAYLSLFTFFMLALVSADNFVQMFFGWEGVGLASYLLIGFWHHKPAANAAAVKAFVVNRVGDLGFALGIAGIFVLFGSVVFEEILPLAADVAEVQWHFAGLSFDALTVTCLLLFIGAMGKSAQLGLHVWLPDAMEGPTPVSALIHAATMVTAGVFMVCRLSPLFAEAPFALEVIAVLGALTAFFAASVALVQNDIKRIIAYSTCSQLGYMFFAAGVSAYGAAMFHLATHAFFKALLFLGAGSVITALHHQQDIRSMGGLAKKLPWSCAALWLGSLALIGVGVPGVFGLAGFYSKDAIIESAWAAHSPIGSFAMAVGLVAAVLTAFYSLRLLLLVFHLPQDTALAASVRAEQAAAQLDGEHSAHGAHHHEDAKEADTSGAHGLDSHELDSHELDSHGFAGVRESPMVMLLPLAFLALGAIFSGVFYHHEFVGDHAHEFWGDAISLAHDPLLEAHGKIPFWVKVSPLVAGAIGIALALWLFMRNTALRTTLATRFAGLHRFLLHKWFFDELYARLFVRPAWRVGEIFFHGGDKNTIDRWGPDGVSSLMARSGARLRKLQTGYLYHYALWMLLGLVLLMGWILFSTTAGAN